MRILKSKQVALLCLCAVVSLALFARTYSVHANPDAAEEAMSAIRPEAIRADMRFLSDDALEGRGTGTRGYDIAAKFMATQFESLGLQPAGDNGSYFQRVPLRLQKPDETKTTLVLTRSGKDQALIFRKDYISHGDPVLPETSVEAPVVFVGDGVTAPDQNYDDYQGIDAKGKIVALMADAPNFESSLKAHYSSWELKLQNAAAHGAVGAIFLDDPIFEQLYSFKEQVRDLSFPELRWLDKQQRPNDYFPQLKGGAFLSLEATKKFFAGSPHSAEEVFAAIKAGKPMSFVTPITAKIHNVTGLQDVASRNVVARLEGSDPTLKNEYVVYSAHLDHLGIGEPVKGDRIYNGAMDNASGSAVLLDVASSLKKSGETLKRSLLFVFVTGEEKGLLGSRYFTAHPTVDPKGMVADINIDMFLPIVPLKLLTVWGLAESDLGDEVRHVAEANGIGVQADPEPQRNVFIRSDQYNFIRHGIPALMMGVAPDPSSPEQVKLFRDWLTHRYHAPSDDLEQPVDLFAAAQYEEVIRGLMTNVANSSRRPQWKSDSFFRRYSEKPNQY